MRTARSAFAASAARSKKLTFGYFAQHQLDELNPQRSAYDHIAELMPDKTEAQKRARTAAAGFGHDKADTAAASCPAARRRGCCSRSPRSSRRIS